ncbi:MAG: DedA family protein [Phycisphaerales bacterium]
MHDLILQHLGDVSQRILDIGPLAVLLLLLLPLGEEIILIPAGMLTVFHPEQMPFLLTWLCAYVGVLCSDAIWFFISRHYGTPLLHKRWFKRFAHPRRLLQAKHQIERRGAWFIVTARFVPGSRTPAIIMAGMLHMPVWKYLLTESVVTICTTLLQLTAGVLVAKGIGTEDTATRWLGIVGVVVLIVGVGAGLRWFLAFRKKGGPPPRANASWLRRFRAPRVRAGGLGAQPTPPRGKGA